jgi:hypothetical protein
MKHVVTIIAAGSISWAVPAFAAPPAQPSSTAYVNTFGPFVGGGQTSQAQTQIRNGVVGDTYDTTGGSSLVTTHSADNYANSAQVTSNTGNFAGAQADLHDGSVHTLSSLGSGAVARAFATSSIGDTVYFNNMSGAATQLSFTFSFSGQYAGDTNSSALAIFRIFGAQGACAEGNYEGSCAGYGPFYSPPAPTLASGTSANQTLQMGYLKNGALVQYGAQQGGAFFFGAPDNLTTDYVLSRTYDPTSGLLVSDITAFLAIPTGASRLGFDLKLNLDCSGAGSSCDFSHTSTFGFGALPTGLTFSSESGAFLVGNPVGDAVPEPATWAMMIVGFGVIGGSTRYRRRKTSFSFA